MPHRLNKRLTLSPLVPGDGSQMQKNERAQDAPISVMPLASNIDKLTVERIGKWPIEGDVIHTEKPRHTLRQHQGEQGNGRKRTQWVMPNVLPSFTNVSHHLSGTNEEVAEAAVITTNKTQRQSGDDQGQQNVGDVAV